MRGFVKRGRVTRQQVIDLLRARFQEGAYYLVQRADDCRFDSFRPNLVVGLVTDWPEGRVFSRQMAVRWRELGTDVHDVMVFAEEDMDLRRFGLEPDGIEWQAVRREGGRSGIYLWGRYREDFGRWVETRIPRQLSYPVEEDRTENRFVRLGHVDYCAPSGAVQFTRLTEVV
jgi:hypothetical protein